MDLSSWETAWLPKGFREVNRLLLCAPTALWKAIERCLVLLAVATLLVATASSAFAAAGTVVTIQGRVRLLPHEVSGSSAGALRPADSVWGLPGPDGHTATHLYASRQPRTRSTPLVLGAGVLEPVASITSATHGVWGLACSRLRSLQERLTFATPAPIPE